MILDLIAEFSSVVSDYQIIKYRHFDVSYELVLELEFIDGSKLFARDYLFADGKRKYSFHWQHTEGYCIYRWDNVPLTIKTPELSLFIVILENLKA